MSECYPVASTVLAQSPQGPIRCLCKPSPLDSDDGADYHQDTPLSLGLLKWFFGPQSTKKPRFHHLCIMLYLSRKFLPYLQPLSHSPALQPLFQTTRLFLGHHLNLLLSPHQGDLAANDVPYFGTIGNWDLE